MRLGSEPYRCVDGTKPIVALFALDNFEKEAIREYARINLVVTPVLVLIVKHVQ